MFRRVLLSMIAFLIASPSSAAPAPGAAVQESAESLYRHAGLERQVPMLGALIEQQLRSEPPAGADAVLEPMVAAAHRAYGAARMKSEILADLRQRWNPALASEALKWLRSPTGRRVIQMEEAASKPEAQAALESFAATLATHPPEAQRVEAMRRLDRATRATDISLSIMTALARAIAHGAAATQPGPASPGEIDAAIDRQQAAMRKSVEGYNLVSFLHTYRDLTSDQLGEYLKFFDSPAGKWYSQTVGSAFERAMESASERFAAETVAILVPAPPAR